MPYPFYWEIGWTMFCKELITYKDEGLTYCSIKITSLVSLIHATLNNSVKEFVYAQMFLACWTLNFEHSCFCRFVFAKCMFWLLIWLNLKLGFWLCIHSLGLVIFLKTPIVLALIKKPDIWHVLWIKIYSWISFGASSAFTILINMTIGKFFISIKLEKQWVVGNASYCSLICAAFGHQGQPRKTKKWVSIDSFDLVDDIVHSPLFDSIDINSY